MNIKIIFNNRAADPRLSIGWGFSCLVAERILFDSGENKDYLFHNIKIMGVDISTIDRVVISHDHWDHTGGLWELLKRKKGLKVYSCPGFSREFKEKALGLGAELIELDKPKEIIEDIFVSGEIEGFYHGEYMPEQALYIKTDNGLTVITGCAHPGIIKIVEKAKSIFNKEDIYSVFGGFHLQDKSKEELKKVVDNFKALGVKRAGPTHCSGKEAEDIFKDFYKDNFIAADSGVSLEV